MAKLTIFLCAVVLASTASAIKNINPLMLQPIQSQLVESVNEKIKTVKGELKGDEKKIDEMIYNLGKIGINKTSSIHILINSVYNKFMDSMDKIETLVPPSTINATVKDCIVKEDDSVKKEITKTHETIANCTNQKVKMAREKWSEMTNQAKHAISNLKNLKEEAIKCGQGGTSKFIYMLKAIGCTVKVKGSALFGMKSVIGLLNWNYNKMAIYLSFLQKSMKVCALPNIGPAFNNKAVTAILNIEKCFKKYGVPYDRPNDLPLDLSTASQKVPGVKRYTINFGKKNKEPKNFNWGMTARPE